MTIYVVSIHGLRVQRETTHIAIPTDGCISSSGLKTMNFQNMAKWLITKELYGKNKLSIFVCRVDIWRCRREPKIISNDFDCAGCTRWRGVCHAWRLAQVWILGKCGGIDRLCNFLMVKK